MINTSKRIFVAGHRGMVGSAIVRALKRIGFKDILTANRDVLDLTNQEEVNSFFKKSDIGYVYNAAAKVGGIVGNANMPGDFIIQNLMIQNNLINACLNFNIDRYIFLGSCCIYPKFCNQPMREDYLLSGELEPTNRSYAVAKIAGIVSCQALYEQYGLKSVCPMPINLFGKGDNLDPENSHIIPGLMRRFHFAKLEQRSESIIWGSGKVKREYMNVDDCADGILFVTEKFDNGEMINIAPGTELTTRETAESIAKVVGYSGKLTQDTSKPDGTMRKLADHNKISSLGWKPQKDFYDSLEETYEDFKIEIKSDRWN
jgi:GDP-L-fucose synthase